MVAAVIDALRRFLPAHLREHRHAMGEAQRRAAWAITHCRTAEMGGHLHACGKCQTREFHFHSCNHRSCPQCGKETEVYARIVGYYRPVKNWNKGKAEEFRHRREFEPVLPASARPSRRRHEEQAPPAPSCCRLKAR